MTTVVLADDQDLVRSGLASVLRVRGVDVVGEAADGAEAVRVVRRTRPDVVLMDIRMPVLDGIGATREIVHEALGTQVLVVTTYDLDSYVYEALRAGASGFLLKATTPDRLVEGIETVARGESLLAPSLTRRLIEAHVTRPAPVAGTPAVLAPLTGRELDVVRLVAAGRTNAEIAATLVVSQATVKTHVNRIFAKLGVESRVQLVVLSYECGFVLPGAVTPAGP
ncbi:MAG TPA: response regulator transcription factor [Ornithinibacter sp.]|nr:response regulator transcription factor [Ornithinibacter sp.]